MKKTERNPVGLDESLNEEQSFFVMLRVLEELLPFEEIHQIQGSALK